MLDAGRSAEWLELLADDVQYRMPVRLNRRRDAGADHSFDTQIFSEDKASLQLRVGRLGTDYAWAELPPSRTRHLVTNVQVRTSETPDELEVTSNVLVYRNQLNDSGHDLFSARREDLLRLVDGQWRLARRTIYLDQAVIGARYLSIFL